MTWVINERTGKRMPLDPLPLKSEGTRFVINAANDPEAGAPIAHSAGRHELGMASHFATCPDRDDWRK